MRDQDPDLSERARRGDGLAYADLVRAHRRPMLRLAYSILGSSEDAEDCVQEAFVRAYQAICRRGAPDSFEAWIRRITVNCAITQLRARRTRRPAAGGEDDPSDDRPTPQEQAEAADLHRSIRLAVGKLPTQQRVAFCLFHAGGLSVLEAADAMGCSAGAAKVHLHRARERLADHLRSQWPGEAWPAKPCEEQLP
jgi:RNA polymerase sigma-70 factor (ECF subfamily)